MHGEDIAGAGMTAPDNQPTIHSVSGIRDGYGREYPTMVPKADLDAANERIRELTIDRDETERERVKAVGRERDTAHRLFTYRGHLDKIAYTIGLAGEENGDGGYHYADLPQAVARYGTDCHTAGYARGEAAMRESPEMRLAIAHRDDCMTYESIIEAAMASLGVEKYGDLPEAARNARLVAEWLIAEVRHRYSRFYDRMRADLDGIGPEATRPAHLRFAATIIEQTAVPKDHGGDGDDQERTARQLRDEADRVEADKALIQQAARDRRIHTARTAFKSVSGINTSPTDGWIEAVVDALTEVSR